MLSKVLWHKGLLALAAVAGVVLLGTPQSARANLVIGLQEAGVNGGAITIVSSSGDFSSTSFTGTYGDFSVSIFGGTSTNANSLSSLLSSSTRVVNNDGSNKTLKLWVSQTDYTLPIGATQVVESGAGGSVNAGTLGMTGIFQAYADKTNTQFGTGDFTNGPQNGLLNGSTFDTGSATGLFTRVGNYSVTSVITMALSGGGIANFSSHVNLNAIPEPATMALALTGLPVLGLYWARRRRNA